MWKFEKTHKQKRTKRVYRKAKDKYARYLAYYVQREREGNFLSHVLEAEQDVVILSDESSSSRMGTEPEVRV